MVCIFFNFRFKVFGFVILFYIRFCILFFLKGFRNLVNYCGGVINFFYYGLFDNFYVKLRFCVL